MKALVVEVFVLKNGVNISGLSRTCFSLFFYFYMEWSTEVVMAVGEAMAMEDMEDLIEVMVTDFGI